MRQPSVVDSPHGFRSVLLAPRPVAFLVSPDIGESFDSNSLSATAALRTFRFTGQSLIFEDETEERFARFGEQGGIRDYLCLASEHLESQEEENKRTVHRITQRNFIPTEEPNEKKQLHNLFNDEKYTSSSIVDDELAVAPRTNAAGSAGGRGNQNDEQEGGITKAVKEGTIGFGESPSKKKRPAVDQPRDTE
ncbi:hypothetical protein K0M31_009122 [Melipona bicolor]|uniref:Uncharacterized protein n=1 Tax=Melipona bicolor TaxID=60889 RepID=A0AA40KJM2_9HYME|nr:hypothetical protein K0M31_009122 [Melipona bicolor]